MGDFLFYFIPAWKNLQVSKVDETLSQMKMFYSIDEKFKLWIVNYMPNLRTILLLEGVSRIEYFSIYDEMQNIQQNYENKLNVYDLKWPRDVSFVYSQFAIYVLKENYHFASIYFDSLNNVKIIEKFDKKQKKNEKIIFDDRGFISSVEKYKDDVIYKSEFYNQLNQLQFTIDHSNGGEVILGEYNKKRYNRETFESMNDFIKCVLSSHFQSISEQDVVVVALDDELVGQIDIENRPNYKLVSSIFSNRKVNLSSEKIRKICNQSSLVLVDQQRMIQELNVQAPVQSITPYDAVLKLGESQQVGYYQIHYVLDSKNEITSKQMLNFVIQCYQKYNWHFSIHCLKEWEISELKELFIQMLSSLFDISTTTIQELIRSYNQQSENKEIDEYLDPIYSENIELIKKMIKDITFEFFTSKEDLLASLLHTRLIIDLSEYPDVLTQICGISTGIPMINSTDSSYIVHQKNGWIIKDKTELLEVMHYYLDELSHWNEALVYSVAQLKKYTDGAIVHKWKEWLYID